MIHVPRLMPYSGGGLAAEVLDPDGNHIELFEPRPDGSGSMPTSADDCMNGGYQAYGFSSEDQCISWYAELGEAT